jgi:hypothetical protein
MGSNVEYEHDNLTDSNLDYLGGHTAELTFLKSE